MIEFLSRGRGVGSRCRLLLRFCRGIGPSFTLAPEKLNVNVGVEFLNARRKGEGGGGLARVLSTDVPLLLLLLLFFSAPRACVRRRLCCSSVLCCLSAIHSEAQGLPAFYALRR